MLLSKITETDVMTIYLKSYYLKSKIGFNDEIHLFKEDHF